MSLRPYRDIDRRKSRQIHVGPVAVGGGAPISVQTMTNTLTSDAKATIEQEAHDVVTFLAWAAEPKMEERKRFGFGAMVFLIMLAGVLFAAYRKLWKDQH